MFPNRLALPVLAVACVTAAAAGGYFAARQNAVPTPAAAQSQPADFTAPATAPTAKPVQETEGVVGDTGRPSTPVAAPSTASTPGAAAAPSTTAASAPSSKSKNARRSDTSALSTRSAASAP